MFFSATTTQNGVEERKQGADILLSLFKETSDIGTSTDLSKTIDARPHSTNVCCIPPSQRWRLQCAYAHGNKLIVFLTNSKNLILLHVYHASSHSQFDEQKVPIFSNHPLFSQEINSCSGPLNKFSQKSTGVSVDLPYMPAFSFLCCKSAWKSGSTSHLIPVTNVFFQQLFGLEFMLAQSILALIGCQKWHNFVP